MINFEQLNIQEIQELQNIISKNVEKSELEKSYLYTHDTVEKARIYIWCFRFLYSIRNLTAENNLKKILSEEIKENDETEIIVDEDVEVKDETDKKDEKVKDEDIDKKDEKE